MNGVNTPYDSKDRSQIVLVLETGPEKSDYENEDKEDKTSEEVIVIG